MELLNVDGDGNAKLSDSKCGQLLHHLKAFPIEFLEDISVLVYPHLYKLQSEIIHDYDGLSRVPEGYALYDCVFMKYLIIHQYFTLINNINIYIYHLICTTADKVLNRRTRALIGSG